jgi:hypothetical protein
LAWIRSLFFTNILAEYERLTHWGRMKVFFGLPSEQSKNFFAAKLISGEQMCNGVKTISGVKRKH